MPIVCVCNNITEKKFREVARRPDVKTFQDALIAAGGKGKQCAVNCVSEGKRMIREEKAARVRDYIDISKVILPKDIPSIFMPNGAETAQEFRARYAAKRRDEPALP